MKYVLVTGVAGFIGSRFAEWIINNQPEYTVIGIDNLSGGYYSNIPEDVIFYQYDLSSANLKQIFNKYKFEYVFHFACYAALGLSPFIRRYNYANNIGATVNIINESINYDVKRLVYASSCDVYGEGQRPDMKFDEDDLPAPTDPYSISKYACEMDIKVAGEQHGLDWCIIRPHNVYGINQNIWDKYRNVLGIWMVKALTNKPMLIYGDGEQTRSFSYIDDCLEPLWNAAVLPEASKQIVNVGGTKAHTLNEANKIIQEVTGYTNVQYAEARHEVKHSVPTYDKQISLLKYKETVDLKEGLTRMWEWTKKQPMRTQKEFDNIEITKGLYSYWK